MKNWRKTLAVSLIVVVLAGIWLYPDYRMLQATNSLFDEDKIVENFRSFDQLWPISELRATAPRPYPQTANIELPVLFTYNGGSYSTEQFLKDSWTTGLLVIQDGTIVYEDYYLGNTEGTRNISWSVAKSFISALFGIAIAEGHIASIEQTVEEYCPELEGSGYEGVRIKDVLQMSTGVRFNEDYADYDSDINRWGRGFALGHSQDEFAGTLKREREPGTENHYVSINTHVLGMILTRATGRSITDYMQEKLYTPLGMEHDGYWLTDGEGMEMALGGLNLTLRDFAKLGSLFLRGGEWNGERIVPAAWVRDSVTPDAPHVMPTESSVGYGYQWWVPMGDEGEFMARGVYNQNIYINPSSRTVIVKLSANPRFNDKSYVPSLHAPHLEMYREIVSSLRGG